MSPWPRLLLTLLGRGLLNPRDGLALARVGWRFRARDWHRQPPFLPLPDARYLRWRMYTAYGDEAFVPPAKDVIRYARWAVRS